MGMTGIVCLALSATTVGVAAAFDDAPFQFVHPLHQAMQRLAYRVGYPMMVEVYPEGVVNLHSLTVDNAPRYADDGAASRHVFVHHRIGADADVIAQANWAEYLRPRPHQNLIA